MTRQDVIERIRESASRGSATPTLGPNRAQYLAEQTELLIGSVIEPSSATVIGETYGYGVFDELKSEHVLAVAHDADRWLLFRPVKGEYSLAHGPDVEHLTIWGFSSPDALAEWLG
ncbi:hypothetical protein GCM10027034_14240 [Ramlibacter solisilvae]|uniref:Uncharacterized protein n=1 Tax=Ramlibacter tataouinensis TaxID=94132 RepID=A0A127JWV2_9BURK|nr:hypothetical protein [Ramlibacter tataouinensis]AMO24353.1 hypothetical protein UC35_17740 [Ramlibacter tataouinensis]